MTHPDPPAPGTTVHRTTARVLPVDPDDRILLLHGWEPSHPDRTYWFTIGGAVEPGETLAQAAARELAEEVGIVVGADELGPQLGTWDSAFAWGEYSIVQTETYFAVRVTRPEVTLDGLDEVERGTIDTSGWWSVDDLEADGTAASPHLTSVLRAAVRALAPPGR